MSARAPVVTYGVLRITASAPSLDLRGSNVLQNTAKRVLDRFKLNMSYICEFCGQYKYIFCSLYSLKIILEGFVILYQQKKV